MERTVKYSADIPAEMMNTLLGMSDETKRRIISLLTDSLKPGKSVEDKINDFPISDKVKSLSGRLKVDGNDIDWDKEREEYYREKYAL